MRGAALAVALVAPVLAALPAACGKGGEPKQGAPGSASGDAARPPVPDKLSGTLTLDGKPLALVACRPGREASIYVDLVTPAGALRFLAYDTEHMYWNPRPDSSERGTPPASVNAAKLQDDQGERGTPLDCADLQRSWGGATRSDGTSYFRGRLIFACKGAPGAFAGDVEVDCGNISPLERRGLDEGRRRKRQELEQAGSAAGSGSSSP